MDILLIRHGECENGLQFSAEKNRPDPKLTARGHGQAELLGQRLAGLGIRRIYASDLKRAAETAEIANRHIGVPVETREELREIDMGRLHACTWEDIRAEDPALYDAWQKHEEDLPYPGGETGGDVAARAMKVVDEIVASGLETVAVVTHGGVNGY
jgi:broad specificity phosphatase PhoE